MNIKTFVGRESNFNVKFNSKSQKKKIIETIKINSIESCLDIYLAKTYQIINLEMSRTSVVLQISFIPHFENKPQNFPDTRNYKKSGCFHTVLMLIPNTVTS